LAFGLFKGRLGAVVPLRRTAFLRAAPVFATLRARMIVSFWVLDAMIRDPFFVQSEAK